jgi:hypothetical protein
MKAQSASVPEDVARKAWNLRHQDGPLEMTERKLIARTIEAQAREIADIKAKWDKTYREGLYEQKKHEEYKARAEAAEARIVELESLCANNEWAHDELSKLAFDGSGNISWRERATRAEARVVELTKARDDAHSKLDVWLDYGKDADQECAALTAENAVLLDLLKRHESMFVCWGMLTPEEENNAVKSFVEETQTALSTPNHKAMRMVEVVKAAQAFIAAPDNSNQAAACHELLEDALAALTEGEKG